MSTNEGSRPLTRTMKLAIVGSTKLAGNESALALVNAVLDRYKPTVVISGGAEGVDRIAAAVARGRGIEVDERLPKVRNWEHGFKPRNKEIAEACDALVRIAIKGGTTYGSGWTRDYAKSIGKPTESFTIDPMRYLRWELD